MFFWRSKESLASIELVRNRAFFCGIKHNARLTPGDIVSMYAVNTPELKSYLNEIAISHLKKGGSVFYIDSGSAVKDVEDIARSIDPDLVQIIQRSESMNPGDAIRIGSRQTFSYLRVDDQHGGYRWMDAFSFVHRLSKSKIANKQNILIIINGVFEKENNTDTEVEISRFAQTIKKTRFCAIAISCSEKWVKYNSKYVHLYYTNAKRATALVRLDTENKISVVRSAHECTIK